MSYHSVVHNLILRVSLLTFPTLGGEMRLQYLIRCLVNLLYDAVASVQEWVLVESSIYC